MTESKLKRSKFQNIIVIIGLVLLVVPNDLTWYWGNLSILTLSYIVYKHPNESNIDSPWMLSLFFIFRALGMIGYDYLKSILSRRKILILGIAIADFSVAICFFAVLHSLVLVDIAMGVGLGIGVGFLYAFALQGVVDISNGNLGFLSCLVQGSGAGGAILINEFVTLFANPNNETPDFKRGFSVYFTQTDILERVPYAFFIIGSFGLIVHSLGFVCTYSIHEHEVVSNLSCVANQETMDDQISCNNTQCQNDCPIIMSGSFDEERNSYLINGNADCNASNACTAEPRDALYLSNDNQQYGNQSLQPKPLETEHTSTESTANAITSTYADYSPKKMLRTVQFYVIWYAFFACDLPKLMLSNYYKAFGQLWIHDDHFLTNLGTAILLANTWLRCIWGIIFDRLRLKTLIVLIFVSFLLFNIWYTFSYQKNRWVYFAIAFCFGMLAGALYSLFPALIATVFGKTYFSSNLAVYMSAPILFNCGGPILIQSILANVGWFWAFSTSAIINLIGFILLMVFLPQN